jgi:hypothetical protein
LAADKDQGRLLIDSIRGFVSRTPGLGSSVRVDQDKVTAHDDIVLKVLAADAAGTYGLRPAFLIVDEIAQWPDTPNARKLWEAASTAMLKMPGARMVVLTTAGDPAHWSYNIRTHAETSPRWRLHELPGPPPWADEAALEDLRNSLPSASYRQLFENRWTSNEERLTTREDVEACIAPHGMLSPAPRTDYAIGLDLGLVNDRTAAVVAHLHRTDGAPLVIVDRLQVWAGSRDDPVQIDDVKTWLRDTAHGFNCAEIVMDHWQTAGMAQELKRLGLKVTEHQGTQGLNNRLAVTLYSLLRNHQLLLPNDEDLVDELINLDIYETRPGQYRMDHTAGRHDDRAVALALAAQHLLDKPQRRKVKVIV